MKNNIILNQAANFLQTNFDLATLKHITNKYGTPTYVYNKQKIIDNYQDYKNGFEQNNFDNYLICYAVKANSNLSILHVLANENAGFDIVSLGELSRVLKAGGNPKQVVFSGVGKQDFEIKAALEADIYCFNVESESELHLINQIAKDLHIKAPISIRINPNIDAKSHPYISTGLKEHKFGIAIEYAENIYNLAKNLPHIVIHGIDCHIGSQLNDLQPIKDACIALNKLLKNLAQNNITISHLNLGGGLGIDYQHDINSIPTAKEWVKTILENINFPGKILLEPGRSIVGNTGILLSKVIHNKHDNIHNHNFTIVDAAMNDLLRPALYSAKHLIVNVDNLINNVKTNNYITSIVGPICESSDVFLNNINFFSTPGDLLAILDTGAYGFTMSSNYNSRTKPAEVMIDSYTNKNFQLIRSRETYEDLYRLEVI